MSLHSRLNQYNGINAHLHSALQQRGWESFHSDHISDLRRHIDALLPAGYYVRSEQSLQLRALNLETGETAIRRSRADLSIYRQPEVEPGDALTADHPAGTVTVAATLPEQEYLRGIVILQQQADDSLKPVTRIELLSPANKPPGTHADTYIVKRTETLLAGINLVELDYLHERRSPVHLLPSYPQREPDAFPYHILVNRPHPSLEQGLTQIYRFRVEDALPRIAIPLVHEESILLDSGVVYNLTFSQNRYYGEVLVDYEQLPDRFDRYDETDQGRIRARMQTVQAAQAQGDDLSQPPLPLIKS